jgi:hypothetical protein
MKGMARVTGFVHGVTLAGMLGGCAATSEPVRQDAGSALSVSWRSCASSEAPSYFDVVFEHDGAVRYLGTIEVREKGERLARIDPRRIQQLARSAAKILGEKPTPPVRPSSGYCLKLKVGEGPSMVAGTLSPLDAPGKELERKLRRVVDLRPWACPARSLAVSSAAGCAPPAITFSYAEKENCGDTHVVRIYAGGQVHYYTHKSLDSDRYYKIDRELVEQLFAIGSKYQGELTLTHVRPDRDHRTLIGASMLAEYKQTLTRLAKVPWQPLQTSRNCPDDQEYPAGLLSLDRQ